MNGIPLMPNTPFIKKQIFCCIQARLGSTRLLRKILSQLPFQKKPNGQIESLTILEHIHKRLLKVFPSDQIIYLIPNNEPELKDYIESKEWNYELGHPEDVRSRYFELGKKILKSQNFQDIVLIRLTGDNPLPDTQALEALVESWLDPQNQCDLLSVTGLPLGMGMESFRFSALEKSMEYKEERHKEHVTLAIKEYPEIFQIGKVPILSGLFLPSYLRFTVDEILDYEMLFHLLINCLDQFPYIQDASQLTWKEWKELYNRKASLLEKNQNVSQIQFSLPDPNTNKPKIIQAIGDPSIFGTGHMERCQILASRYVAQGYHVEVVFLDTQGKILNGTKEIYNENKEEKNIHLLKHYHKLIYDARDSFPMFWERNSENFKGIQEIILIDHLPWKDGLLDTNEISLAPSHAPVKVEFIYLLPHPQAPQWLEKPILCIPRDWNIELNIEWKENQKKEIQKPSLLIYMGSLPKKAQEIIELVLINYFQEWEVFCIGNLSSKRIPFSNRLTKTQWKEKLQTSTHFLSYFGQGLIEAIYWGLEVATFSISSYHAILSQWMEETYKVPYWGELEKLENRGENMFYFAKTKIHLQEWDI